MEVSGGIIFTQQKTTVNIRFYSFIDTEHGGCNIALWQQVVLTVLSRRGETIGLIGGRMVERRGDNWRGQLKLLFSQCFGNEKKKNKNNNS